MGSIMSDIKDSIKSIFSIDREKIKLKNLLIYISLISIFIIALLIRLTPAVYEPILKGFDPWFQYRQTEYIVENGFLAWFNWHDPYSWAPFGRDVAATSYPGLPFMAAALYLFIDFLGVPVDLLTFAWFFPAFMGALTAVSVYFLGKEVGSRKIGLIAAILMALIPAFLQRSIAGFFDNESVGILLMVLTTYFYIRSIRRESILSGVFAGFSLALLTISWGAYTYFYYLFPLFNILLILTRKHKPFNIIPYILMFGISIAVGSFFPILGGFRFILSSSGLISMGVLGILVIYELYRRFKASNLYDKILTYKKYFGIGLIVIIVGAIGALAITGYGIIIANFLINDLGYRFISIINPLVRSDQYIVASVAEHSTSAWGMFYYYLYVPVFFFPVGIYFSLKRANSLDILLILFSVTSIYFAASMIRLMLILAPIVSLMAAYGLVSVLKPFSSLISKDAVPTTIRRKRVSKVVGRETAVIAFGIIFILLAANTLHAVDFSRQLSGSEMIPLGIFDDWRESFTWMQNNLDENDVILSWWDYGYWITTMGNRTSLMDNGTFNFTQIATLGRALVLQEEDALRILRDYGVDHVLVHFGYFVTPLSGDEGKWVWMVRIASNYYSDIKEEDYLNQTTGPTDKFFDSLIYKLLFYKEPGTYDFASQVLQQMNNLGYPTYQAYPSSQRWKFIGGDTQYPMFDVTYVSSNALVKIFELDYTILDMSLDVINTTTYTFNDKTVTLLEVENNGTVPITLDVSSSAMKLNGSTVSSLGGFVSIAEGSALMNPNDTVTIKIDFDFNSTISEELVFDVQSLEFYGYRTATGKTNVRSSGTIDFSLSGTTAYSNETIFLTVENTGEEYLTISNIYVNGSTTGLSISGDKTLSPGQIENYTIIINRSLNPTLDLNISDIVNINVSSWEGVWKQDTGIVVQQPPGYSFDLNNVEAYSNETILFNVYNNGTYAIDLEQLLIDSALGPLPLSTDYLIALNGSGTTIQPGTTVRFLANWDLSLLDLNQSDVIDVTLYTFEDLSQSVTGLIINSPVGYDYNITGIEAYDNETIYLTLSNTGNYSLTINQIFANSTLISNITAINGSMTINPGTITQYMCYWDPFVFNTSIGEIINTTVTTYADLNRTSLVTVLNSNYSMVINSSLTELYDNNTITITINNTGPIYSISNITIYIYNSTSGENETILWDVIINPSSSETSELFTLTSMNLNLGEDVDIYVKSIQGASDIKTVTILSS
jgi:dolichyl-diphosphooligosaccharide--protein glycosyltransferase